jgi:hypothetical protein
MRESICTVYTWQEDDIHTILGTLKTQAEN